MFFGGGDLCLNPIHTEPDTRINLWEGKPSLKPGRLWLATDLRFDGSYQRGNGSFRVRHDASGTEGSKGTVSAGSLCNQPRT